jgi:hypothetical protein
VILRLRTFTTLHCSLDRMIIRGSGPSYLHGSFCGTEQYLRIQNVNRRSKLGLVSLGLTALLLLLLLSISMEASAVHDSNSNSNSAVRPRETNPNLDLRLTGILT